MIAQLPSNMLITRVRPGVYLPICALLWSGVSAATAGTTDFGSLIAVRFILGIVEAPLFPGVSAPEHCLLMHRARMFPFGGIGDSLREMAFFIKTRTPCFGRQ